MQTVVLGILGFIFVMGLAVLVHEFGHFIAARKFGVKCHEFAIGMGPALWKKRKGETLYKICAIPIGGYVMMGMEEGERNIIKEGTELGLSLNHDGHVEKIYVHLEEGQINATLISNTLDVSNDLQIAVDVAGERKVYPVSREAWYVDSKQNREQQIVPIDRRLENKTKLQRLIIMSAGAVMNFVLAYVLAIIVSAAVGETVGLSSQLEFVNEGGPAYEAGLQAGDTIIEVDGVPVIDDGTVLTDALQVAGTNEISVVFERDGVMHETAVTPIAAQGRYVIGINIVTYQARSFAGTFTSANARFISFSTMIFDSLHMLVTGEAGVTDLSGPVGIAYMTSQVATQGFLSLLTFAALININLGIFNLLPLPALDGGHITFIVIEAIIGKPVDSKIQNRIAIVGLALFMGLFVFTFFNDIFRFFINS